MKKKRIFAFFCALTLSVSLLGGCGEKVKSPLDGKWSYIYDTEKAAFYIKGDSAVLDGEKYGFSCDDEKVYLKDNKGYTTGLRYVRTGENSMYLYKQSVYQYQGDGSPDGLLGVWVDIQNGNSSFEFTSEGTFREDSYIPGYYSVNDKDGSILLVYNDHYEDTTIYFTLKDNLLYVEYPWPMVIPN